MNADERPCPDCAETIKAAAKVCKHCGYRLDEPPTSKAATEKEPPAAALDIFRCPSCQKPTRKAAGACRHCHAKFDGEGNATGGTANWADRTFEGGTKSLVGCLAPLVAIGLLFIAFNMKSPDAEDEVASTSSTPSETATSADHSGTIEIDAVTACDIALKQGLAVEPDLDFGWSFVPRVGSEYRVVRGFKAENGFGATLKHTYFCTYNAGTKLITKLEVEGPGGSRRII